MTTMTLMRPVQTRPGKSVEGRPEGALRKTPRRHRSRVRLTRRGRFVVVLLLLAVALVAFTLGRTTTSEAASAGSASAPTYQTVVVEPGQTLWQLAAQIAPHTDPRVTVQRLVDLNDLAGPDVVAGQQLAVPRG
jgi:hypothetical protein